jgi:transcriptional regulator GlxA family with amidase domain
VSAHLSGDLSVASIAAVIGISPGRLAHTFRTETGTSLKRFVTRVRVTAAQHLMAASDEKVARIARQVGFFDASHLGRVLRSHGSNGSRRPRRRQ